MFLIIIGIKENFTINHFQNNAGQTPNIDFFIPDATFYYIEYYLKIEIEYAPKITSGALYCLVFITLSLYSFSLTEFPKSHSFTE